MITNTCPGCLWVGAPTEEATLLQCTTFHCRVDRYFVTQPWVCGIQNPMPSRRTGLEAA